MKNLIILFLVIGCGKDPSGKTRVEYIDKVTERVVEVDNSVTPTYCSGVTRQGCFQRCLDESGYCNYKCLSIKDLATKNGCEHDCQIKENQCVYYVNDLPVSGEILK